MEKPVYRMVDGYYRCWVSDEATIRSALNYVPKPEDVFIVSYPKSGNTWLNHIAYNIMNDRAPPANWMDYNREIPFLEKHGAEATRGMRRPGFIKTHMPFHLHPYSRDAKYICICRNPYDCCVSFYHHTRSIPFYLFCDGTFDEFLEMFMAGEVDCGDYFDHLLSWYNHRNDPNVFFLTYEDLKEDTANWAMKIADFLGDDYGKKLRADKRALENVLSRTSFEAMKEHVNVAQRKFVVEQSLVPEEQQPEKVKRAMKVMGNRVPNINQASRNFVRKGVVGDWKTHFSAEHAARLKEHIAVKTLGSDVMSLWKKLQLP
ncbi:sulfotransferase 1E1-like [Ixodes scapularis]|uniref:sulfotransferase 1E1-like n=1 Tax=Ixodes scapularis TaxID=6945 RepID=UPI001C381921|nr:sulfotransferase 1E1-like [Ixodes scapularis]